MTSRCRLAVLAAIVALVVAACSSSSTGDTGSGDGEPGSERITTGVTDDEITLAALSPEAASAAAQGIDTSTDVTAEEALAALIDPINEAGGIHGRTLRVEIVEFDPLTEESRRAACLRATEDLGAFAAFNAQGLFGPPVLCLVDEHRTPFVSADGFTDEFYQAADDRLFTVTPAKARAMVAAVDLFEEAGVLDGAVVGVLGNGEAAGRTAIEDALVPRLEELGHEVADVALTTGDVADLAAQIPPFVEGMRQAGVDTVFLGHNVLANSQFVTEAAAIGWSPRWLTSDQAQGVSDLAISLMPAEAYDGALGVTSTLTGSLDAGEPETRANRECRERIESGTGVTLTREDAAGNEPPAYNVLMLTCSLVDVLVAGLEGAGPDLHQRAFLDAVLDLDDIALTQQGGPGSFGPGKHDAPDFFRPVRFDATCDCWVPEGDFAPVG